MQSSRARNAMVSLFLTVLSLMIMLPASAMLAPAQEQAGSGKFDGPAELPRVYMRTAVADSPATGPVHLVREGDDLQEALDRAKCGETLQLQQGATFSGRFRLPEKSCDDSHWIVLRTSAPDSSLPREGTRLTPCFAGVSSLPGRPDFHCSSTRNVMAKIQFEGRGEFGPLVFMPGANHYRIIGLEITRGNAGTNMRNLVQVQEGGTADHIIFDRIWAHGDTQDETKAGVHLSDMTFVGVVDSFFTDFHCVAIAGACTDAQAINGGGGHNPGGPYRIVGNFLEASGQSIMFGGSGATTTPADIEIRRNYLFKPLTWKPGQPGFVGGLSGRPFIVKNHFELKNAQRVLFEGNILENNWGGFTQSGFSVLLTPRNQNNVCPLCRVTDVTIRYNKISHVASALQIANGLSGGGGAATAGERYSIHDLLIDDIDGDTYKGFGSFLAIGSVTPPLKDIRIDHVTAFPPRVLMSLTVPESRPRIENVVITNNILNMGERGITSAGGGQRNCAFRPQKQGPAGVLNSCFSNITFTHNLIIGGGGGWPKGNIVVGDAGSAGIRDFRDGSGGDYRLCREKSDAASCQKPSPAIGAGTDGKDIGADIHAIEAETKDVR
jgi:hypothetical protein